MSHVCAVALLSLPVLGALALFVRLPLDETIAVYAAADAPPDLPAAPGSTLVARHEMWLAGLPYLTMHDQIRRRSPA